MQSSSLVQMVGNGTGGGECLHSGPTPRGREDPEDLVSAAHTGHVSRADQRKSSGLKIILRSCLIPSVHLLFSEYFKVTDMQLVRNLCR